MDEWLSSGESCESVGEREGALITLKVRLDLSFLCREQYGGLKKEIKQTCSHYSYSVFCMHYLYIYIYIYIFSICQFSACAFVGRCVYVHGAQVSWVWETETTYVVFPS